MAQLVRSAFNQGGTWQGDGLDQGDAAQFNRGNQNLMAQLALAQLQSGDARFGAERQDRANENAAKYGFMGKELAQSGDQFNRGLDFQNQSLGKQYDFMGKQADQQNSQWGQQFAIGKQQFDEQAPLRQAGVESAKARTALDLLNTQQLQAQIGRQNAAGAGGTGYAPQTTAGKEAMQTAALGGAAPGVQEQSAKMADMQANQQSADLAGQGVAQDLGALESKSSRMFGANPTGSEVGTVQQKLDDLIQQYIGAGLPKSDATSKAQGILRSQMPKATWKTPFSREDPIYQLYQHLGMQVPN